MTAKMEHFDCNGCQHREIRCGSVSNYAYCQVAKKPCRFLITCPDMKHQQKREGEN